MLPPPGAAEAFAMARILIIDDKEWVLNLYQDELQNDGHVLLSSAEVESLAPVVSAFKPEIVLLNLDMERFNGWNVLLYLKIQFPQLPVIIVAASEYDQEDVRFSQADDYLLRDFLTFQKLKEKVQAVLQRKPYSKRDRQFISPV